MVNCSFKFLFLIFHCLCIDRNATEFYVLIMYPANILNSLMSSSISLVVHLGFSIYIISSVNSDSFTSSFPVWISFISFPSWTAVAGTSNTILFKGGNNGHPCLVPDLIGNAFTTENDICCEFVIYALYYLELASLNAQFLEFF